MNIPTRTLLATAPRSLWLAATSLIAAGLQLAGVYAAIVTFGALLTAAIYVVGSLVALLQHFIVGRIQP